MKQIYTSLLLAGFFALSGAYAQAQDSSRLEEARALIAENPDRAGSNMHSYEFKPIQDTPAPAGYQPFYITHYGRHGSRYEQNSTFSLQALAGFHKADSLGLLTGQGQALYKDVQAITDEHKGMEGQLSPRGGREHQRIAERMADRFPEVFNGSERNEVSAVSSTSQRSIISMANFTGKLNQKAPCMQYSYTTGDRYMPITKPDIAFPTAPIPGFGGPQEAPQAPQFDFSRFLAPLFKDGGAFLQNKEAFARSVFSTGILCQDLDFMGIEILRTYFNTDELVYLWPQSNNIVYLLWGNSLENGEGVCNVVKPLLKDIVDKADEALSPGSHRAADLRFGHDTGVLPLVSILGRDDPEGKRYPFQEAHKYWFSFQRIPMASNFQMILYKNPEGDVLAKVLYNEEELILDGITPAAGPYYHWIELRDWMQKRL